MFDKQTKKFCSAVLENLPAPSEWWMQYLISHPKELKQRLKSLLPLLFQVMPDGKDVDLLELDPSWDFMIMRSMLCPEVGIAVSKDTGQLEGGALPLVFGHGTVIYTPCGCCRWTLPSQKFSRGSYCTSKEQADEASQEQEELRKKSICLVRNACKTSGISTLIFANWDHNVVTRMAQDKDGLHLVSPHKSEEMQNLPDTFYTSFDWLKHWHNGVAESLTTLK